MQPASADPERAVGYPNLGTLQTLRDLLKAHGALGYRVDASFAKTRDLTEADKLGLVPLVFWLLPRRAIHDRRVGAPVKPMIREHLDELGVNYDEELLDILKGVADKFLQYQKPNERIAPRKWGMADLRQNGALYRRLLERQAYRCNLCGAGLGTECQETLDHVVPYGLIGDVSDGANWQILCHPCNVGKGSNLSALQTQVAVNWVYGHNCPTAISSEVRYVMLATSRGCRVAGCAKTRASARLHVRRDTATGIDVAGHLTVVCDDHAK